MACVYCNDDPAIKENCYCRDASQPSNIFDRIGTRVFEAKANTKAYATAICINNAGVDALLMDRRIYQQDIDRERLLASTLFGLPFKLLDDRPNDKFPDHWRFYLEYRTNDDTARKPD